MGNMFKKIKATSIPEYIELLPLDRKKDIQFLHALIKKTEKKLKPHFAYNMLGYGSFPYRDYKKELKSWPIVALASQKNYISIYICAVEKGKYLAESHKKELGNVSVGRSCIRFKKIEDVNLPALKNLIKKAAKTPGLVGAK